MRIKRSLIFFILLLLLSLTLEGQQVEELYSPVFLTGGVSTVSSESPMADILNPAVSGADQLTTLDLSYIGLHNFVPGSEGYGMAANLGLTYPSQVGVFSSSLHFIYSPFTTTALGTMFEVDFSFAKDIYPHLLIGAGAQFVFGSQGGTSNFGLGADLGFVHMPGDLWLFKDFTWGFAIRDLGKGFNPQADINWLYSQPFTPAVGVNFKVLKSKYFDMGILADFSFPTFQNFNFNLGTELRFFDLISLRGAFVWNTADYFNGNTSRSVPFTFGLSGTIPINISSDIEFLDISERGWDQGELNVHGVVLPPLHNDIKAIGVGMNLSLGVVDRTPPVISLDGADTIYISPDLDGTSDVLELPLKITDRRYIKGYKLVISDQNGNPVREIQNKDERPENVSFENVLERLVYVKTGITVPESIRWDGKSETGTVVADGNYTYHMEAWDDNGNIGRTEEKRVVVDNTDPELAVEVPYLIFSPNSDGNKDVLLLDQSGSREDLWQGTISAVNGNVVRNLSWEDTALESYSWDGRNNEGILVPDGVYMYVVSATDRAGNTTSTQVENIIINTEATPININISLADFSPNGDGIKDKQRFTLEIPVTTGIEKWELSVVDAGGEVVKTFSGISDIPSFLDFDGTTDGGEVLAEGTYAGSLELLYNNGNNPNAASPEFRIDLTPPDAVVKANLAVFSPNNDGNKDTVVITQNSSNELLWSGEIRDQDKALVRNYSWKGIVDSRFEWDGLDNDGLLVEDGAYNYQLTSTDKAGNTGKSEKVSFQLNTEETPVILSMNYRFFSPNKDGVQDVLKLIPHLQVKNGIENYSLEIRTVGNKAVKSFSGKNNVPEEFNWDGTDNQNKKVPDGQYYAQLDLLYRNGNRPVARTINFVVDTVYPEIKVSADYKLFSPDDDGRLDTLKLAQDSSIEELWDGEILNTDGEVVRSFFWKGEAADFEWDGRDENNNILDDGFFTYRIFSTDKAGNSTTSELPFIEIDKRPTSLFLTVQGAGLSPNGDDYLETITFVPYVNLNEKIKEWELELVHREAGVQMVFRGQDKVPGELIWDGKGEDGNAAREGFYTGTMRVEYLKGNMPVERTSEFRLDATPPQIDLVIEPEYFSPDNDGLNDELKIRPNVSDLGPIMHWDMEILDPKGKHFTSFQGKGEPADEIIWDGISDTGELVQSAEDYRVEMVVSDDLGNVAQVTDLIPIDILVIREGNRLKIKIASITFAPNTADYLKVEADRLERNLKTIARLGEIFKKYEKYRILIEGHAVSLYWENPQRAAQEQKEELVPLSKERAESIKRALVEYGLNPERISTEGVGGSRPVVPHGDLENRWKNRRVEFILIRQ